MRKIYSTAAGNQLALLFERFPKMPWHASINAGVVHVWNRGHNNILSQLMRDGNLYC
jgi:hypothetical protein